MGSVQIEQKSYYMPPAGRDQHRAFSHREGHRAIGSLLRKGLRRSHSEPGRRQRAWIPSAREYLDDCERGGRADSGQADGIAQRPRPESHQQLYELPGCGYSACYELWKSRGAEFITEPQPKYGENPLLHPRS